MLAYLYRAVHNESLNYLKHQKVKAKRIDKLSCIRHGRLFVCHGAVLYVAKSLHGIMQSHIWDNSLRAHFKI